MDRFINLMDLAPICTSEEKCIQFLYDEGLLPAERLCPRCGATFFRYLGPDAIHEEFHCARGHKKITQSVRSGTWFENDHIPLAQVLLITYCFARNYTFEQTVVECSMGDYFMSHKTVADWFSYCREVCMASLDVKYVGREKIGGLGHDVHVDECQIGGKKISRGRMVKGNWILCMIDSSTNEVRMEVCPSDRRIPGMVYRLIAKHVDLDSTIVTSCWGGFNGVLYKVLLAHLNGNDGQVCAEPLKPSQTGKVESRWKVLRNCLTRRGIRKESLDYHLCEYLWRQDCKNRNADPFQELVENIRMVYSSA